ncbi:DEAD/DEAH box helicase [Paenibacillus spongiae]|uniref:DEAD/DEAH box helicase family protein n=1 Tax=Paenibacillus spongiae TaxID=2909671 RepID=A0ABY5S7K9_9BACL|nr:helicase-related protein [Paenibacillus spongiae]UVI29902.1 DEAD/DEAH box helicase family protein [Paenibacillus spongiae]
MMKVHVYVVVDRGMAQVHWTIAPELDCAYWLNSGCKETAERVAAAWSGGTTLEGIGIRDGGSAWERNYGRREEGHSGRKCLFWSEPIPLGIAVGLAEAWPGGALREWDESSASAAFTDHMRKALQTDEGSSRGGMRSPSHVGVRSKEGSYPHAAGELQIIAAADRTDLDIQALAAHACRLSAQLRGRALLAAELLALLEVADGASAATDFRAAAPALQLAALLGLLRLGRALAPQRAPRSLLRSMRAAPGARPPEGRLRCLRCGSGEAHMRRTPCAACGRMCAYCEACLAMGRSRECGLLILGTPAAAQAPGQVPAQGARAVGAPPTLGAQAMEARLATWKLSPAQAAAAAEALRYIEAGEAAGGRPIWKRWKSSRLIQAMTRLLARYSASTRQKPVQKEPTSRHTNTASPAVAEYAAIPRRSFLLWAVTGAGKTEMIFPLVEACLQRGGHALIATPRRDVVLELDPRLRRAFPQTTIVTLYGGSPQRWENGGITLATTHQLFRFQHAFELVVIDELDAFPYHGDPLLHYAAAKVCKPEGVTVLLSATPPAELQAAARRGRLPHVRVPVRFHRHPLPVPIYIPLPPVRQLVYLNKLPKRLVKAIQASVDRGAQLFVFVQQIRHIDPFVRQLRREFPGIVIEGTSSKDDARGDKVHRFRDCQIRLLVTTTILERGVTVPRSDVFIMDADGRLFDDASLVQMAGRAGRSKDDPAGKVYFFAPSRNRAQQLAIRQITGMNKLAKRKGYLLQDPGAISQPSAKNRRP